MLQKYVSSWTFDAKNVTLRGSAPSVLQPAYGSSRAATTTSGADTTLILGQFLNAPACTTKAVRSALGLPTYGRKTTNVARFSQFLKASAPMLVTEAGMVRLANAVHPLKASSPITVTESGMLIDFILSLTLRDQRFSERLAVPSGTSTAKLANALHWLKAPCPIKVTDDGIVTLANEVHPLKAPLPMLVTDDGIARLANKVHPVKAPTPMLVTDDGIARLANELHPQKALSPILVTDDGIVKLVNALQS